ncbi:MAG: NAD(P)/FAD-dependent oxidoreductase [Clostridia bacterium]|nr:NAD(P)/FAD-dependent oxidoreductase [Clostridia bacterium]
MKIVIIGAGIGGLQSARVLAEGGHDVTVYERSTKGKISYDWRDDVEYNVFDELGVPIPSDSHRVQNVSFLAPFSDKPLFVYQDEDKMEWGVYRHTFGDMLASRAEEKGAKILYETSVESLITEDEKVKGIVVDGEPVYADLVIDCSGMDSKFRASLPESMGITKTANPDEAFNVYRAHFNKREGVAEPQKHRRLVYLKPEGALGISWVVCEPDGTENVLIGRIGSLSQEEIDSSIAKLKELHPIIGDDIVYGGRRARIPIRYPLLKMVGEGYVAIGDSAFMTIPLIGSGIACSLRAGQMLGETINEANSVDVKTLWKYQVKYYQKVASEHFLVDCMKRKVLVADNDDIKYVIESGFITEDDIKMLTGGEGGKMKAKDIFKKLRLAMKKLPFVLSVAGALLKGIGAMNTAKKIPTEYDEKKIAKWVAKLQKVFA